MKNDRFILKFNRNLSNISRTVRMYNFLNDTRKFKWLEGIFVTRFSLERVATFTKIRASVSIRRRKFYANDRAVGKLI